MKTKTNSLIVDPKLVKEILDKDAAMVNGGIASNSLSDNNGDRNRPQWIWLSPLRAS